MGLHNDDSGVMRCANQRIRHFTNVTLSWYLDSVVVIHCFNPLVLGEVALNLIV